MNLKLSPFMAAATAAGLLLGGCGGGGNGSAGIPKITSTNPAANGKLVFNVGTANIAGTPGVNVVTYFRTSSGISASLVNTPSISGPSGWLTNAAAGAAGAGYDPFSTITSDGSLGGVAPADIAASALTGTPQTVHVGSTPTATTTTTFGQSGGVFSQSLSPGNETNSTAAAYSYVPYGIDVFNATALAGDAANAPWGGPPSFDPDGTKEGLRDGLNNLGDGVLGIPEGFTTFEGGVAPTTGTYTMNLSVATGFSGPTPTFQTVTSIAALKSATLLPTLTAPAIALDGSGGGTVTLTAADFAGGISQVYVEIVDTGIAGGGTNCQGVRGPSSAGPVYYTIVAKAAGTVTLPDNDGPNVATTGGPSNIVTSPSICTAADNLAAQTAANNGTAPATPPAGDSYEVVLIGLDYDMYDASYPIAKTQAAPATTDSSGQTDITVSAPKAGISN